MSWKILKDAKDGGNSDALTRSVKKGSSQHTDRDGERNAAASIADTRKPKKCKDYFLL